MFQIKLADDPLAARLPKLCSQLPAPQEHQKILGQGLPVALLCQKTCCPMAHHLRDSFGVECHDRFGHSLHLRANHSESYPPPRSALSPTAHKLPMPDSSTRALLPMSGGREIGSDEAVACPLFRKTLTCKFPANELEPRSAGSTTPLTAKSRVYYR